MTITRLIFLYSSETCQPDQGSLDVRYLSERYNKGTGKVAEYSSVHQRYVLVKRMEDCLPDILGHIQTTIGPSGTTPLLGWMFEAFVFITFKDN